MQRTDTRPRKPVQSFTEWAREQAKVITTPIGRLFIRLGIHPNTITIVGFVLSVGVAVVLGLGHIRWGGWLVLLAGSFDALDGAVARLLGQKSRFGAFLDSTLDRLSEAAILSGLIVHLIGMGSYLGVVLALVSLASSFMVSYTRARAEALGIECKVGVLTRFERALLIAGGLILGFTQPMLWVLALLASVTAVQRIWHVYRVTRSEA